MIEIFLPLVYIVQNPALQNSYINFAPFILDPGLLEGVVCNHPCQSVRLWSVRPWSDRPWSVHLCSVFEYLEWGFVSLAKLHISVISIAYRIILMYIKQ